MSSSTSPSSAPETWKKCACCHRILPDIDYSGAQLKAKGKRLCKVCVAGIQSIPRHEQRSGAVVKPDALQRYIGNTMSGPLESERLTRLLRYLIIQLPNDHPVSIEYVGMNTQETVGVLRVAQTAQTDELRLLAFQCIALMCNESALLAQLFAAGVIPVMVGLLRRRDHEPSWSVITTIRALDIIASIAQTSRTNCDMLLASSALDVLLPFIRVDMSSNVCEKLFPALTCLMRDRQPAADMILVVTRLNAILTDHTVPLELFSHCAYTLDQALCSVKEHNFESWAESILTTAPEIPQRLVELMDASGFDNIVVSLMADLFDSKTAHLRQLFDCGLMDKLLPLLNNSGGELACKNVMPLCSNIVNNKDYALLLINNSLISQRILTLVSTSEGDVLHGALDFVHNIMCHRDRYMTGRLVNDYSALPSIVSTLRRVTGMANPQMTLLCLRAVNNVLVVGVAESEDDPREINPYIEPLDWLGVFELAAPLQKNVDVKLASAATRVFAYFIPNDCE